MKPLAILLSLAGVCAATSEPIVSLKSLMAVEASINEKIASSVNDPYDVLGTARGTYIEGYGAVFSVEINLVLVGMLSPSPFKPTITEAEKTALHERKAKKLEGLKETLRGLIAGASKSLPGLPGKERIAMEAILFSYRWENNRDLPHRVMFTAEKQKLLDALERHDSPGKIAALFTEDEL